jgi:hypothetical protein
MHLVEHLLLRPMRAPAGEEPRADDAAAAQVTLVFSGWTARGADPRFRKLAAQILDREAPAHLRCRLAWLDAGQMQAFETAWHAWLGARAAWCADLVAPPEKQDGEAASRELDERSARVRALLQEVAS